MVDAYFCLLCSVSWKWDEVKVFLFTSSSCSPLQQIQFPFNQSLLQSLSIIFSPQDSEPRHLLLNITRIGGLVGDVAVNVSVGYILPGSSSSSNDEEQEVTLTAGSSSVSVTAQIANDQFIKLGAAFKAELTGVALRGGGGYLILVQSKYTWKHQGSKGSCSSTWQCHPPLPPHLSDTPVRMHGLQDIVSAQSSSS